MWRGRARTSGDAGEQGAFRLNRELADCPCDPAPAQRTTVVFPYGGLGFFPPVQPEVGDRMLFVLGVCSVLTSLGLFTRVACVLTFVLFTWIFHIWCAGRLALGCLGIGCGDV